MTANASLTPLPRSERRKMMDVLILLGLLALWFALQMWILPRFGVRT